MFVVSAVVGAVLVDIETVAVSFVGAFALAVALVYVCFTLPGLLGIVGALSEVLYRAAVVMVFKSIFPFPLIVVLIGGFFGSILGEMMNLR